MMIFRIVNTSYYFLHMGERDFLSLGDTLRFKLAAAGVQTCTVTDAEFQSLSPVNGQGSLLRGLKYG